jgi:CheY-like chemotaxis protein
LLLAFDVAGGPARRAGRTLGAMVPTPSLASLRAALAIAERLAGALGGTLRIHAAGQQRWRVQVSLPVPAVTGVGDRRVLLVDADGGAAAAACAVLAADGFQATHAGNALAALSELAAGGYDVVVVDTDLPGIDGLTLLGILRAQHPHTPVLAMCAQRRPGLAGQVRSAGGAGLLLSPITAGEVRQALSLAEPFTI